MTGRFRIGTRASPLALAQTDLVVRGLHRADPELGIQVVPVRTSGDRTRRVTGTLDFTDEITRRLEQGTLDAGVHSAKDLPAAPDRATKIRAYLPRADPRDCLVLRVPGRLKSLPRGARIGSSSLRRRAQLLAVRPDAEVVPIRGNIGTRLESLRTGGLDGIVLAAAGLRRLGLSDRVSEYWPASVWLPAPGQGAIAIEARVGDRSADRVLRAIDHRPTRLAVEAERAVVRTLGGDCELPLGAFARIRGGAVDLRAALFSSDGRVRFSSGATDTPDRAIQVGVRVGRSIRALGDPERLLPIGGPRGR